MKREDILLYMTSKKTYVYLKRSDKEYILDEDTSLFFKLGEISNEKMCEDFFTEISSKMNFGLYYLKPDITVLYNDVCSCDLKFLYSCALRGFNYNLIDFVPLSKVVKIIRDDDNTVVFDDNYYTLIGRGEKSVNESSIDFDPVFIGKKGTDHIHYADEDLIWTTFKSHFTKRRRYDIIDVGDD